MDTLDPTRLWEHPGAITLEERAYRTLRDAITVGSIPPGTRLVGARVASQLGVSRTTTANAIKRLATEGLVIYRPHADAAVSSLDQATLREVFLIRHALEDVIMREVARGIDADTLDQLASINNEIARSIANDDPDTYRRSERDYHMLIYASAPVPLLASMLTELWNRIEPYRGRRYTDKALLDSTVQEHRAIEAALAARDVDAACLAMRAHVETGHGQLAEALRRELSNHGEHARPGWPPRRMSARIDSDLQPPIGSLRAAFGVFDDSRRRQGRMFDLNGMLSLIVCAMVCGARSGYAVTRWGRSCHPEIRAALGLPFAHGPSGATIHRVLTSIDREQFERVIGQWLGAHDIQVDATTKHRSSDSRGVHGEELPGIELLAPLTEAYRSAQADGSSVHGAAQGALIALPSLMLTGAPHSTDMRIATLELRGSILERMGASSA